MEGYEDKPYVVVDDGNMEYARENLFWVDRHMRGYEARDVGNSYLEAIIHGIPQGKYVRGFLDGNADAVIRIFAECERRNIFHGREDVLSELLRESLFSVLLDGAVKKAFGEFVSEVRPIGPGGAKR